MPPPPELLILPEHEGAPALPFLLIRDRFRTLRIQVRRDGSVEVRVPARLRSGDALRAVVHKRGWIEAKRRQLLALPPVPERAWTEGEEVFYLGRPFRIRLIPAPRGRSALPVARLNGDRLDVRGADLRPDAVRRAVEAWRKETTLRLAAKRLARLDARMREALADAPPAPRLRVRALTRRWGSCEAGGTITLACRLSALPLRFVDYILLHELCHLRRMDHSPSFHALLARFVPEARQTARELHLWARERDCC